MISTHTNAEALAHVYWIGGSPCSGKSSITAALAAKYDWQVYSCDDAFYRHWKVITPAAQPTFARVLALAQEDLWMRPVIAEGAALLAEFVQPYLADPRRYIAIVPSAEFQLAHYSRREWIGAHLKACSDPQQAFRNWMERDIQYGLHAFAAAEARGLKTLIVDGRKTLAENLAQVETHFGPTIRANAALCKPGRSPLG